MRFFILANGKASRWDNYMGVDKQLIVIDGEPLLNRTVRLLKENGQDDIYIIGKYQIEGAKNYIPEFESIIGKFDSTKELWNDIDSFCLLYGDCYYTEAIIKDICERETDKKWLHWACNRPNKVTGKVWEEGYAQTVYDIDYWKEQCEGFHKMYEAEPFPYKNDWVFLRFVLGLDLFIHQPELMKENEIDWEDETDDFDFPVDYDNWMIYREVRNLLRDKVVLITGNGSFANAMIERLLNTEVKEIRIYSRNEEKQVASERKYEDNRLKFVLGDIRDYKIMHTALESVDYCIHTAALKHVKKCEENPIEAKSINVDGSENVILACINRKVKKLCCLSTDKAANACTTHGATKYMVERLIVGIDNKDTTITMTRYGNVAGSSGSVIPYFNQLKKEGKLLTLTDPNMTRFYIPMEKAIDSVLYALVRGKHKDLIVYKSKSATVQQIADCISDNQVVTGAVKSEKTDEALLTERELNHCIEDGDFFIYNEDYKNTKTYDKPLTSDNAERYEMQELKNLIARC